MKPQHGEIAVSELPWLQVLPVVGPLAGALIGVLGGLGGAVLTHRLNRGKHVREKLWERRIEAYSEIVTALDAALRKIELVLSYYEENAYAAHQSEQVSGIESAAWSEYNSALKLFVRSSLVLSDDFVALMRKLREEVASIPDDEGPPVIQEALHGALQRALPIIAAQGKKELCR